MKIAKSEKQRFLDLLDECISSSQHMKIVDPFGPAVMDSILKVVQAVEDRTKQVMHIIKYDITSSMDPKSQLQADTFTEAIASIMGDDNVTNTVIILERISIFFGNDPVLVQLTLKFLFWAKAQGNTVIFLCPAEDKNKFPEGINDMCREATVPLPDTSDILEFVTMYANSLTDKFVTNPDVDAAMAVAEGRVKFDYTPEMLADWSEALEGMSMEVIEDAFKLGVRLNKGLTETLGKILVEEKMARLETEGVIITMPDKGMDKVGGIDRAKKHCYKLKKQMSKAARKMGLPFPTGIMLLGVSGCGKSLLIKVLAYIANRPIVWFSEVFDSHLGESEKNVEKMFRVAQKLGAIVFLDEIEKLLGSGGGEQDGGSAGRVLGSILTKMQDNADRALDPERLEKEGCFFVAATANDIKKLKIEIINRFPDLFSVDLPNGIERREVLTIHLKELGVDVSKLDMNQIVSLTKGYTSRELCNICVGAQADAFDEIEEGEPIIVTTEHIKTRIAETPSLSVTAPEAIKEQREWVLRNKAKLASTPEDAGVALQMVKM